MIDSSGIQAADTERGKVSVISWIAIGLLLLAAAAWGFSIDRYPQYMVDDAFFNFPAINSLQGHGLVYKVSSTAPFWRDTWGYHGPLYPNLERMNFKLFGTNQAISRLPEFIAGWSAALLVILLLIRRRYTYAPLIVSILWIGDRSTQELMFGRMDGLALLFLVGGFLFTEKCWSSLNLRYALAAGVCCGIACGFHPLTATLAASSLAIITLRRGLHGAVAFLAGTLAVFPLLLACWHFQVAHAVAQFSWHAKHLQQKSSWAGFVNLLHLLRWSSPWLAMMLLIIVAILPLGIQAVIRLRTNCTLDETSSHILLGTAFGFGAVLLLVRSAMFPYYLVYFTLWPIMLIAIIIERSSRWRTALAALVLIAWLPSAAWNLLRFRENVLFHRKLGHSFIDEIIASKVPASATIVTVPELYMVPVEASRTVDVLPAFAENAPVCDQCYILITSQEQLHPKYMASRELGRRRVLYAGPAFPGAGPLSYPVALLSPAMTGISRTLYPAAVPSSEPH